MKQIDGRVAIVTGAGRGIGREEALLLASEGAAVVVNDVGGATNGSGADISPAEQVVREIEERGGRASANSDDVSSWEGAQRLVQQAIEEYGDLNILVNNAGILRDGMSFRLAEEDWDAVIRVHLRGHFAPARFAAEYWRARSKKGETTYGRIINTTSDSGLYANPGQINYATAKAGIASMTLVLARELAAYGVTVNAVAPRARTRLTEDFGFFGEVPEDGSFDRFAPERVAPVVGWLASDLAADVSGQVVIVNGDNLMVVGSYRVEGEIDNEQRPWTVAELGRAKGRLFSTWASGIPENATPNW